MCFCVSLRSRKAAESRSWSGSRFSFWLRLKHWTSSIRPHDTHKSDSDLHLCVFCNDCVEKITLLSVWAQKQKAKQKVQVETFLPADSVKTPNKSGSLILAVTWQADIKLKVRSESCQINNWSLFVMLHDTWWNISEPGPPVFGSSSS